MASLKWVSESGASFDTEREALMEDIKYAELNACLAILSLVRLGEITYDQSDWDKELIEQISILTDEDFFSKNFESLRLFSAWCFTFFYDTEELLKDERLKISDANRKFLKDIFAKTNKIVSSIDALKD